MSDFEKYKSRIREYLDRCGVQSRGKYIRCPSPLHEDKNPSCEIYDDGYKCYSCGVYGDIYDVAGLLHGVTDVNEQYKLVSGVFGGGELPPLKTKPTPKYIPTPARQDINQDDYLHVLDYIKGQHSRQKHVMAFLAQRGYPPDIAKIISRSLAWWPGYEAAVLDGVAPSVLQGAGIPERSWTPPGVVTKGARGLKLMYYRATGACAKIASHGYHAFPACPLPEDVTEPIYLVEAELSALSMRALGYRNVYGIGGVNNFCAADANLLRGHAHVILVLDGDGPGLRAAGLEPKTARSGGGKSLPEILRNCYDNRILAARLPGKESPIGKDPDDMIRRGPESVAALADAIASAVEVAQPVVERPPPAPAQIAPATSISGPRFTFLGFDQSSHYVIPHSQDIVLRVPRGDNALKGMLCEVAPQNYWAEMFPADENSKAIYDRASAMAWFREMSHARGVYDSSRETGIGAYWHESTPGAREQIVINTGERLYLPGVGYRTYAEHLESGADRNLYVRSGARLHVDTALVPWTAQQGVDLLRKVAEYAIPQLLDTALLVGWMALAPWASLLPIRPHIWLCGPRGCGKTTLLNKLIVPAVGESCLSVESTVSTEAGIRQTMRNDCRPLLLDEAEKRGAASRPGENKIAPILRLLRSAYSGDKIIKGSAGHQAMTFGVRFMALLSSVSTNLVEDADRSRIIVIPLSRIQPGSQLPDLSTLGCWPGMRWRVLSRARELLSNISIAAEYLRRQGLDHRQSDTYGVLLGGAWTLCCDKPMLDDNGCTELLVSIRAGLPRILNGDTDQDHTEVLDLILDAPVKIDGRIVLTPWQVVTTPGHTYSADLQAISGVRGITLDGQRCVAVNPKSTWATDLVDRYSSTGLADVLSRHPDLISHNHPVLICGRTTRCIVIKLPAEQPAAQDDS